MSINFFKFNLCDLKKKFARLRGSKFRSLDYAGLLITSGKKNISAIYILYVNI